MWAHSSVSVLIASAFFAGSHGASDSCDGPGSNWTHCRLKLVQAAFGQMPTRTKPDAIIPIAPRTGVRRTGRGRTDSSPALDNNGGEMGGVSQNVTALVWSITDGPLTLNATVFWSLNTTGSALAPYPTVVCSSTGTFLPPCGSVHTAPSCCNGTYVAPEFYGHFAGQVHVDNGQRQTPYSLPITGADTGPLDLPQQFTKTLVLYHNGHGQLWNDNITTGKTASDPLCVRAPEDLEPELSLRWHAECWFNWDSTPGWLNELGYDVMEFNMPLLGPNNNGSIGSRRHEWFAQWEAKGVKTMRFFLEPISLAINYAGTLGYTHFVMVGLSGGGWSTTVAAALDKRISLSFPTAGSLPFSLRGAAYHDTGDWEQFAARPIYEQCNYECMYTLAGLEPGRVQVQLLHEADPCCFRSGPRHSAIIHYNQEVSARLAVSGGSGSMCTAATTGNVHEVNMRDKALIAYLIDRLEAGGFTERLTSNDCARLPFNVLHRWGVGNLII